MIPQYYVQYTVFLRNVQNLRTGPNRPGPGDENIHALCEIHFFGEDIPDGGIFIRHKTNTYFLLSFLTFELGSLEKN